MLWSTLNVTWWGPEGGGEGGDGFGRAKLFLILQRQSAHAGGVASRAQTYHAY